MQCRMIGDVLHLIDKSHRTRVAAEKFERQLSRQPRFIEFSYELRASVHDPFSRSPHRSARPASSGMSYLYAFSG